MVDSQPLPSWNDGAPKSAILDFVARVTKQGGSEFAPPGERVATFDNDGTLSASVGSLAAKSFTRPKAKKNCV